MSSKNQTNEGLRNRFKQQSNAETSNDEINNDEEIDKVINVKEKSLLKPPKEWLILVTIRIVLNLFSQRSYIHPDEFFQGVEIISGDIFNCSSSVFRAWEFEFKKTGSVIQEPIRNMAIPYFFYGLPLYLLKYVSSIGSITDYTNNPNNLSDINIISVQANTLIYYPRLFMTIYSLIIDLCLFYLSKLCDFDQSSVLITFASSYITHVYLTRTFSNSIETILFAILINLVIKSIKSQYVLNDKFLVESMDRNVSNSKFSSRINPRITNVISSSKNEFKINNSIIKNDKEIASSTPTSIKRLKFFDIYKYNYLGDWIGLLVCIGLFNRPTFLIYAFVPIFYWIMHGLENCNNFKQFAWFLLKRILTLAKLFVPFSFIFVLFDTIYFYKIDNLNELIFHLKNSKFILTPYNFFLYNSNPNNLKEHGEHPFYQHIINSFLLFGLNNLILILIMIQFFLQLLSILKERADEQGSNRSRFKQNLHKIKQKCINLYTELVNNLFCFFIFAFLVPLIVFSLVSHKEPRFLLPLLIPICLLTGHCLFGKQSYAPLRVSWIIFNFICLFVYGYFHQGGVLPSLNYMQKVYTHVSNLELDQHVIYYHTYMPPRYLVMAPVSVNLINNKRYIYEQKKNEVVDEQHDDDYDEWVMPKKRARKSVIVLPERKIYDLMSSSNVTKLEQLIYEIKNSYKTKDNKTVSRSYAIFLVAPSIVDIDLTKNEDCYLTGNKKSKVKKSNQETSSIGYHLTTKFKFHITFEHLNDHLNYLFCKFDHEKFDANNKENLICLLNKCKKMNFFERALNSFSLNLYQIIL